LSQEQMRYLFDHLGHVRELLALSPVGLFTDVDGTVSEIAPSPAEASVSESCRESLGMLAKRLPLVAAVSGRSAADTREMVGVDGMVYIGNHGYERWAGGETELLPGVEEYAAKIKGLLIALEPLLKVDGLVFEYKGPTATVHYRSSADRSAARDSIVAVLRSLPDAADLRIGKGKMSIEIKPPLEVSKGTAVVALARERGLRGVIYLGDDLTDVDAFRALHGGGLSFRSLCIGVVGGETVPEVADEADLTLNGVGDVERFLRQVAAEVAEWPAA
jgi:trehalose 6-phosphate phosphatase